MDLPIEVTLKRPVVIGDQTYATLSFDEPDLGSQLDYAELEATFSTPPSKIDATRVNLFWITQLAQIPDAVAKKIKDTDLEAINEAVETILEPMFNEGADGQGGEKTGNETPAK